jgi:transcriptional regulator with XRE-family HTH domain
MAKHSFNSSVGGNIRRLRENNNWSQHVIADRLNISIPAYSKIETGVTDVNLSRLEQIAHVFDIDLAGLFTNEGVHERISSREHERLEKELLESEKEIIQLQRKVIQLYDELHQAGNQ